MTTSDVRDAQTWIQKFFIEYFNIPSVWLAIILGVLHVADSYVPYADDILSFLFLKQFYLVIFIPIIYLTAFLATEPFKINIKQYAKKRKISALIIIAAIFMSILVDLVQFVFEPILFLGHKFPEIIKNAHQFRDLNIEFSIIGLILPIISAFQHLSIRKEFAKQGISHNYKIDLEKIIPQTWMLFIVSLIVYVIIADP